MRFIVLAAIGAALVTGPNLAQAQGRSTTAPVSPYPMKGSPNASGFGAEPRTNNGAAAEGARTGADQAPSATGLRGSPNANGYSK